MKVLYIIALILTVVFGAVNIYFIIEYQEAYSDYIWSSFSSYDYGYYDYGFAEMHEITFNAALVSIVFMAFFILTFSLTLGKIKRMTAKVISIIGLSLTGLFFLLTFVPLSNPGGASWNEFGPVLLLLNLVLLAFNIVNLVQAVRNNAPISNQSTVDDLI